MVSMYEFDPCCTCQYRRTDGLIRTSCLSCKHAYFPMTEAYETKSDLYVKENDNATD